MQGYLEGFALAIPVQFATGISSDFICQQLEIAASQRQVARYKKLVEEDPTAEAGLVPKEQEYRVRRSMNFACIGSFVVAPLSYTRYFVLDLIFAGWGDVTGVVVKTGISLATYTPLITTVGMSLNEYLSPNGSAESVVKRLKCELWKVLAGGYFMKLVTTLICMSFKGSTVKFCVDQVFGIAQNIFSSWRLNVPLDDDEAPSTKPPTSDAKQVTSS